jgi:hypothetical protein
MEIIIALVGGLVGGIAGALVSGKVISYAHYRYALKHGTDQESKKMVNLFQALYAELAAVWTGYQSLVGEDLEKADEADEVNFAGIFAASEHYFSVYDNSAQLLGVLDPDSGKQVIETYVHLKLFLDEVNNFARLSGKQREVRLQANINVYEAKEMRQQVEGYFDYLKKRQAQVKGLCLSTLELLKEFLALEKQSRTSVKVKI